MHNMKARSILNRREVVAEGRFFHVVVWRVPTPVLGCTHPYKYRLAYVVDDVCVLRFDNERGRGDHWHYGADVQPFEFQGLEQLLVDFEKAMKRWNDEHGLD
ncbi:MAG: hypothetical protein J5820_04790 [Rhodocyclaceae bacterium]|nr:hypothetical protein [Rhodocyclaceae bacterium]